MHNSCSIKEVIGRIIRNTRVSDSTYIADMPEWIGEAMGMMKTKFKLVTDYRDLLMDYHVQRLPSGLQRIVGVVYNNYRLKRNSTGNLPLPGLRGNNQNYHMTVDVSLPHPEVLPEVTFIDDTNPINTAGTFIMAADLPYCDDWYFTELDHLHTSFSSGVVRLYYKRIPVDEQGYPLIVDDEFYKSAIYWYVRGMMIGAGFEDKQFTYNHCYSNFEYNKIRARNSLNALDIDRKEEMVERLTRLIIPSSYLSDCI